MDFIKKFQFFLNFRVLWVKIQNQNKALNRSFQTQTTLEKSIKLFVNQKFQECLNRKHKLENKIPENVTVNGY